MSSIEVTKRLICVEAGKFRRRVMRVDNFFKKSYVQTRKKIVDQLAKVYHSIFLDEIDDNYNNLFSDEKYSSRDQ